MSEQPDNQAKSLHTDGGPAIEGGVDTGGGDFVGRDKIANVLGDEVHGDKVGVNKVTIGTIINNLFNGDSEDVRKLRTRQSMLKLVYDIWVKGVLEHSLYNQLLIDLDMEQRPEAVERPWGMVLERPDQASRLLPSDTKMINVFTDLNQSMLILGEPGSGKSTMLLELARDLLAQAEQNPALPIPVLFNLSSWTEERQLIGQWLVDELREKYQIPKALAQAWVEQDELLLLLDGLDEVKREYREDCVKALNEFQQSSKALIPLVLCSRTAEYEALASNLKLNGAIVLRSLTSQQINAFLLRAGDKLSIVAYLLQRDVELQVLVQSPLIFNILCLTYQDKDITDIEQISSVGTRLQQLFDAYIVRMFQHTGKLITDRYPRAQTLCWLTWLATRMVQYGQTSFLIEHMQPSWLYTTDLSASIPYSILLAGPIIYGLIFGLIYGLIFGLSTGLIFGLHIGLIGGLIYASTFGLREGLIYGLREGLTGELHVGLREGLIGSLANGISGRIKIIDPLEQPSVLSKRLISSLCATFFWWLIYQPFFGLNIGLIGGLSGGLVGGLRAIEPVIHSSWQLQKLKGYLYFGLGYGLSVGLSVGLSIGLVYGLNEGLIGKLIYGVSVGLSGGLLRRIQENNYPAAEAASRCQ